MSGRKKIAIFGAGAAGVNAALVLDKLGYDVTLVHDGKDIFDDSAAWTAYIWHITGAEYFREGHHETGHLCIQGAAAMAMMFPFLFFSTDIKSSFHVSSESASDDAPDDSHTPFDAFCINMEHMREFFTEKVFNPYMRQLQIQYRLQEEYLSDADAYELTTNILGHNPQTFAKKIESYNGFMKDVVGGYEVAGSGINMPHMYAYYKALFKKSKIKFIGEASLESATKTNEGHSLTLTDGTALYANSVLLSAGISNPGLTAKFPGSGASVEGTYYANIMVHFTLPEELGDEDTKQIYFILQQQFGAAFTCVNAKERRYVVYKPCPDGGSQKHRKKYQNKEDKIPIEEWKKQKATDTNAESGQKILELASQKYPALKFAEFLYAEENYVFNAASIDSKGGTVRSVRTLEAKEVAENVHVIHAPKLTNALLAALEATHQMLLSLGHPGLPTNEEHGMGPSKIDVMELSSYLNFKRVAGVKLADALKAAEEHKLPVSMVNRFAPEFFVQKDIIANLLFTEMIKNREAEMALLA